MLFDCRSVVSSDEEECRAASRASEVRVEARDAPGEGSPGKDQTERTAASASIAIVFIN